jgi:AraC-like DNA-binding protein
MSPPPVQRFHRDPGLPFAEVRDVRGALDVCYARHSHESFSVGAVTGGRSLYLHERGQDAVGAGAVVLMNPQAMHACNPLEGETWSYRMIHLDAGWLADVQRELGFAGAGEPPRGFDALVSRDPVLLRAVMRLADAFADPALQPTRHEAALDLVATLHERLAPLPQAQPLAAPDALRRVADHLRDRCAEAVPLAELCEAGGLSASHLVRSFKARYGMTPHAWLLNHRIQRSRAALRRGRPIAEVAHELGFADQAHLQRTFKRLVAATPGQYRRQA